MKFSVIIPLYNKASYVRKAVDSVFAQSYTDYEIIIVDDGSTDDSGDVVDKLYAENKSVRIIHQRNLGVASARNNGVSVSSGSLLCFLDADDWWEHSFLEEMNRFIGLNPGTGIYASNYVYHKTGKTRVGLRNISYVDARLPFLYYPKTYYEDGSQPVWTGAVVMPRSVFDEMGGFPLGIKLGEDFLLWAKVAMKYKIAFLDKPLAYYNNNIPASVRATRNIHAPKYHMLFNMDELEADIDSNAYPEQREYWHLLFDKLRAEGLFDYWLTKDYHNEAALQLKKVNWNNDRLIRMKEEYEKPLAFLRIRQRLLSYASDVKRVLLNPGKKF